MHIHLHLDAAALGEAAAQQARRFLRETLDERGEANLILATGASQFEMLQRLTSFSDLDWARVRMFHLDEYLGMDDRHPASFRRYLRERFVEQVPALAAVHWIAGDAADPQQECERLAALIRAHPIDLAMIGIGENGHLAFNDPPADFETEAPFIVVDLDEACRRQQLGEGWFDSLDEVPRQAISMSIRQILKSRRLIVSVPDRRKAQAVHCAVEGPLVNTCPASILQTHPQCELHLDRASASLLHFSSTS